MIKLKDLLTEAYRPMKKNVAKTIVDQLGGRRFQMFVGAKKFLIDGKALFFKIGQNSKKINGIKVISDRLYETKYNKTKSPERDAEVDNMIVDIQSQCKLVARDRGNYGG